MIPKYRTQFNAEFTAEKYQKILDDLKTKAGIHPLFRVSESPIFLPKDFKAKLDKNLLSGLIEFPLFQFKNN